jgi:hypothetical protein
MFFRGDEDTTTRDIIFIIRNIKFCHVLRMFLKRVWRSWSLSQYLNQNPSASDKYFGAEWLVGNSVVFNYF